jgi:dynein heavy chain 1
MLELTSSIAGMNMAWDHLANAYDGQRFLPGSSNEGRESRHFVFVREFASVTSLLQDKAVAVIDQCNEITRVVESLGTCDFKTKTFAELLSQIQKIVSAIFDTLYTRADCRTGGPIQS